MNLLFNAVVFGMFVGVLVDYVLGRFLVPDPRRIVISSVVAVIVGFFVGFGHIGVF